MDVFLTQDAQILIREKYILHQLTYNIYIPISGH